MNKSEKMSVVCCRALCMRKFLLSHENGGAWKKERRYFGISSIHAAAAHTLHTHAISE